MEQLTALERLTMWDTLVRNAMRCKYMPHSWDLQEYLEFTASRLWQIVDKIEREGTPLITYLETCPLIAVAVLLRNPVKEENVWDETSKICSGYLLDIPVATVHHEGSIWKVTYLPEILWDFYRGSGEGGNYFVNTNVTLKELYGLPSIDEEAARVWMSFAVNPLDKGGVLLSLEGEKIAARWLECLSLQKEAL